MRLYRMKKHERLSPRSKVVLANAEAPTWVAYRMQPNLQVRTDGWLHLYFPSECNPKIRSSLFESFRILSDLFKSFRILSNPFGAFGSFRILSSLFVSFRILSGPFGSSRVLSDPFGSFRILSGPFGSFRVLSGPFGSFRILSGPFGSFRVLGVTLPVLTSGRLPLTDLLWVKPALPSRGSALT